MTTDPPPPRRKWHLQRWLLLLAAGFLAYGGWTQYAFRAAIKEAEALGWTVEYTDPVVEIRKNWKAAFKKATWLDGVWGVTIPPSEEFEQNVAIIHRLNPMVLWLYDADTLRAISALKPFRRLRYVRLHTCTGLTNVDGLKNLSALQEVYLMECTELTNVDGLTNLSSLQNVWLDGCTGLTNVDALKNLSALQDVWLSGCTGLTNVDALKNLPTLQKVWLGGCTGLSKESVASLQAALPNTEISAP